MIHWFLCDVDDAGNTFNCEYAYTQYVGSCNQGLEPCGESCGGEENDVITISDYEPSGTPVSTYGPETEDPSTGIKTKQSSYNWLARTFEQRGPLGGNYKWEYRSYETGNLEKINDNSSWKFTSLVHNNILIDGTTPPGFTVTHTLGQAVPSYSSDVRTATMFIAFSVSVQGDPGRDGFSYHKTVNKTSPNLTAQ